jgi:hypothetical protein
VSSSADGTNYAHIIPPQTLTDPGYRKLLAGALEHITTREDFHFFPAEFTTIIDK